jgi:hypothetical protein
MMMDANVPNRMPVLRGGNRPTCAPPPAFAVRAMSSSSDAAA